MTTSDRAITGFMAGVGTLLITASLLNGCSSPKNQVHPKGWGFPNAPANVRLAPNPATTATMYDTITLDTVPSNPFALAGYTSGYWPTYLPLRHRYPKVHVVSIDVTARYHGACLDAEPGDATPSQVVGWVLADRAAGFAKPCVYSSYYEFVEQIRPRLSAAGIKRSSVWEWDADYTYVPHIDAGFDGTQYTDRAFGRNLDASIVTKSFLSIAQPPYQPPNPPPPPSPNPRIKYLRGLAKKHHCYLRYHKPRACSIWAAEVRALEHR